MWSCVPQELWTSYLHCLSSPWTTDQRQGGIRRPPPHSLPPPFLFVSPLSVSPNPLLPFPSLTLLLCHPLYCSLAFFPSLFSLIPLTNFWGVYPQWLMWIGGCSWAFATTTIRCALFICHWILIQGVWSGPSMRNCNSLSLYSLKFGIASPIGLFRCLTSKPTWWQSKGKSAKNVYIWIPG